MFESIRDRIEDSIFRVKFLYKLFMFEARRIALAVVIMEFVLVGLFAWGIENNVQKYFQGGFVVENAQAQAIIIAQEPRKEENDASVWQQAEISAYTASVDETDANPLIMASGKMVYIGAVACSRDIPLGTKLEIRGRGIYVCEDRMNARYTNNIDIFMLTKQEAKQFGRKTMDYRVLE